MPITLHPSMSDKIIIVDFEDSFTYNIANVLFPHEKNCRVISHKEFFKIYLADLLASENKIAIIFGPGPGHPDEYKIYFEAVKKIIQNKNIFCMGICLGHQIMARAEGKEVSPSLSQMHGQSVEIEYYGIKTQVQRYNSLAVFNHGYELDICEYQNGVSYQFHPESVGTHQNDIFFARLLNFIKSQ